MRGASEKEELCCHVVIVMSMVEWLETEFARYVRLIHPT